MSRRLLAVVAAAAAAVAVALAPGPAGAADIPGCPPERPVDERLDEAQTVFVGQVVALEEGARVAYVRVIRVWKGPDLPRQVQVRGTIATQAQVVTALDRLYAQDRTYLFAPLSGSAAHFVENQCSATTQLTPDLAAKAPAGGGQAPTADPGVTLPAADRGTLLPLAIGGVAAAGLAALLALAIRSQRRRQVP